MVESEAGGITQHMSAYTVEANSHRIVFLDTPDTRRSPRCAPAGPGSPMWWSSWWPPMTAPKEQTIEALNHARAAEVPIVVAVNKMDKPSADPDLVMRQLAERGVTPEEWGGDSIFCRVSAKTREGLPDLLQSVLDVAELEEPTADPTGPAQGVVLEARKDRGRGPVAQLLVQSGTLAVGDTVSAGSSWGKVRALLDEAGPATQGRSALHPGGGARTDRCPLRRRPLLRRPEPGRGAPRPPKRNRRRSASK